MGDIPPTTGSTPAVGRPPGRWGLVVVRGRSMEPTLYDGDRLLVRYAAPRRPGQVALVRLPGGVVAVKRLAHQEPDGAWWVERDNPREGVDSWAVGAVAEPEVWGVAAVRLWPRPRGLRRRR
jgi:phage repressor protein C with HTH and peptisase S24 domain